MSQWISKLLIYIYNVQAMFYLLLFVSLPYYVFGYCIVCSFTIHYFWYLQTFFFLSWLPAWFIYVYIFIWVIIKIHVFFYYYAINSQLSTKMIGENIFCPKAQHISIVLPSTFRLVQLRIYTCYTKTCFVLGVTCYFSIITYF